jgi:2-polyprenyl-3-methyl-5-hydroxy-6-metoxy-1,4-benzoquinol methylase
MSDNLFQNSFIYNNANDCILNFYHGETRILDIGCGTGLLAKAVRERNPESIITGLDISPYVVLDAEKNLDFFSPVDLDNDRDFPDFEQKFDLIILGDVLEHLKRPDILLEKLSRYLHPEGKIIISIPNIAHWSIRLDLLMGRFIYQPTGILDNSHLRFFTYQSIRELIEKSGYEIIQFNSNISAIPLRSIQNGIFSLLLRFIGCYNYYLKHVTQNRYEWEAIQFIFKVQVKK